MKKPKFNTKGRYYQGVYNVINKEKYIGTDKPLFRSSYEKRAMVWADSNKNVIKWGSEIVKVPYVSSIDKRLHTYFVDLYCEIKDKDTEQIKKYLIEIKPYKQTQMPTKPKIKNIKSYNRYTRESKMYIQNQNKWQAAINFCNKRGWFFITMTEKDLI